MWKEQHTPDFFLITMYCLQLTEGSHTGQKKSLKMGNEQAQLILELSLVSAPSAQDHLGPEEIVPP